eukprot:756046-Hanusia_phi.AAC.1
MSNSFEKKKDDDVINTPLPQASGLRQDGDDLRIKKKAGIAHLSLTTRNRTKDTLISARPLQSDALPTEL